MSELSGHVTYILWHNSPSIIAIAIMLHACILKRRSARNLALPTAD
jgi:hypothetical protein